MVKKVCILMAALLMMTAMAAQVEAKSLWRDGMAWSLYSDRKARDVGDIVTIVINESTTLNAAKSRTNSKSGSTNLNAGIGVFRFLAAAAASGDDSFEANGSASDTSTFVGNVTVTVVEVMDNGNLIVEGTQSIWQNRDEHKITLRGIVRRDDITANNTIPSTKVADATVRFDGKGPLNAKQRQGILTQVFNFLF